MSEKTRKASLGHLSDFAQILQVFFLWGLQQPCKRARCITYRNLGTGDHHISFLSYYWECMALMLYDSACFIQLCCIWAEFQFTYHTLHFKVVVANSGMICKKGFAPHTGACAIPPTLLDTWLTHNCHSEHTRSPSILRLGKPPRKHHSLLNTQCFGEFTPHQLSLSRLRKIVPEEHHLYSALQAQTSPGIQTYRDAPFSARQTPREHCVSSRVWCFLEGLPSRRFDGLLVCSGWQLWISQVSSKVGGIARAPVWGATLSFNSSPKSQPLLCTVVPSAGLRPVGLEVTALRMTEGLRRLFSLSSSDTDSRCYLVFTRCLSRWKRSVSVSFVSLVMFVPGEHYISGALQAQSSSTYSSSNDEGWIPPNTVYWALRDDGGFPV